MTEPRRYVGFCEEGVFNPAVAPAAVFHVDISSATLDVPTDPNLHFEGGMSRGKGVIRPGYYSPAGNIVYPIDIRSIGYLVKWALGLYKFTNGGGGTNTHEIYPTEDIVLPSFTVRLGKDHFEHVFRGCVLNGLELTIQDNFIFCTLDIVGAKDTKDTLKEIASLTLFNEHNLTFIDASLALGIGAEDYNCKIKGMTLTITNGANADAGKGMGQRYSCRIPIGNRDISIKGNLWFEDSSQYTKFWGAAGGVSADGPSSELWAITIDSGIDGSMGIKLPSVMYTDLKTPPSGRGEIVQAFSGSCLLGAITLADAVTIINSEILVTVENNNADMDEDIVS